MKLCYPCTGFQKVKIYEKKNISKYMFIVHVQNGERHIYFFRGTIDIYQNTFTDRGEIIEIYVFEECPVEQDFIDLFGYRPGIFGWQGSDIYEWECVKNVYLNSKLESASTSPEEMAIKRDRQEQESKKKVVSEIFTTHHYICPHCKLASAVSEKTLPFDIKAKFSEFIANQKDIPAEFAAIVNDKFWDLI